MPRSKPRIDVVILAAGLGTRMKSEIPKVLHPIMGKPMIAYILDSVRDIASGLPVVVVGSGAEMVKEALWDRARFALQEPQQGTAHAVMCTRDMLRGKSDIVIAANSDNPLVTPGTYQKLVETHLETGSKVTISTVVEENPRGFGRVVRGDDGRIMRIVEEKAATEEEKQIRELNSNPYCFDADWLWGALDRVRKSAVGEYYITDLVEIAFNEGETVSAVEITDRDEAIGINNRVHLAEASKIVQRCINRRWMLEGVTMADPDRTYIEESVTIGRDTVLHPEVYLHGDTSLGAGCEIGPSVVLEDTSVGDRCKIRFAVLEKSILEHDVDMGPFAHLRPGAHLQANVHMGNFGEVKNSTLGPGAKMGHFSYIGDSEIGPDVNIGAGTVTCNFDGQHKHKTIIEEGAFIGSDTMLVAPVRIGKNAKTGAGAVVNRDVPEGETYVGVPAKQLKKKEKDGNDAAE